MDTLSAPSALPTLLLVDDEDGPRQSLRMVFRHDFEVHAFDCGEKALGFARETRVHVAILDIRMAGMSGIDVLRRLKEIDPHIEVLMLTAYETLDTARQALRLGACDYLSKPFDLSTMRDAVSRALHFRRISDTVASSTERLHALANQLKDTSAQEEMARTTTEIYASALHDINNPLAVIGCYLELLKQKLNGAVSLDGGDLESVREKIHLLAKHVQTCGAITRRYLRFANKSESDKSEISVNHALADVRTLMRRHPAVGGGRLCVTPLEHDLDAQIGSTELVQILVNLVVNGFQASEEAQELRVQAEQIDAPLPPEALRNAVGQRCVNVNGFANNGTFACISVTDQGPGIPEEVLDHVFEPYFTTKGRNGTGLGLAIVSRFVKQSGGLLQVRTASRAGTRFTLYLPARPRPAAPTE